MQLDRCFIICTKNIVKKNSVKLNENCSTRLLFLVRKKMCVIYSISQLTKTGKRNNKKHLNFTKTCTCVRCVYFPNLFNYACINICFDCTATSGVTFLATPVFAILPMALCFRNGPFTPREMTKINAKYPFLST